MEKYKQTYIADMLWVLASGRQLKEEYLSFSDISKGIGEKTDNADKKTGDQILLDLVSKIEGLKGGQ